MFGKNVLVTEQVNLSSNAFLPQLFRPSHETSLFHIHKVFPYSLHFIANITLQKHL